MMTLAFLHKELLPELFLKVQKVRYCHILVYSFYHHPNEFVLIFLSSFFRMLVCSVFLFFSSNWECVRVRLNWEILRRFYQKLGILRHSILYIHFSSKAILHFTNAVTDTNAITVFCFFLFGP